MGIKRMGDGSLDALAFSDLGVIMRALAIFCLCLASCPSPSPVPIYTPVPTTMSCVLAAKINAARLIRDPDSGYADFFVCDAGAE
jgi:hypothetical protein